MTTLDEETTISATWWTADGPTNSHHWLEPVDGYIQIEIDEALTLSLTGFQALQLLFYLTGDSAIDMENLPTSSDSLIAWKNAEQQSVIRIKSVFIGIDSETSERLAGLLRRLVKDSPYYHSVDLKEVNWRREGF